MASVLLSSRLPDEVLSLICSELGADRDYATLYSCARACKSLADPALRIMYRHHEDSPAFKNEDVEMTAITKSNTYNTKVAATANAMSRQSNVWRSIILSTQEETFKPYCVYLRVLDFRNLSIMLDDYRFADKIRSDFFEGLMERFHFEVVEQKRPAKSPKKFKYLDVLRIVDAVGAAVTGKAVYLEELHGHLNKALLPDWVRSTPYLQSLTLYHGDALSQEAGIAMHDCAQKFKNLTILEWRHQDADEVFGSFLRSLNPDTLEYLEMIGSNLLGELSFNALSTHAMSLKELKLNNLTEDAVKNLHNLRSCTSIQTLSLEDNTRGRVHLEVDHADVFVEVVAWLSACDMLRDLSFKNFFDGPSILARVLSSQTLNLERLSLEGYELGFDSSTSFHAALSFQRQLKTLELKGSYEEATPNHYAILVESLCNMPQLETLRLKDISDDFDETHITNLALNLPLLEDFWTSGQNLGADILPILGSMRHLKTLNIYALTQFYLDNILDFIRQLDETAHHGFTLSLMAQDAEYSLTEEEQAMIRKELELKLDGRFEFALWRDEEWEPSDDD